MPGSKTYREKVEDSDGVKRLFDPSKPRLAVPVWMEREYSTMGANPTN